MNIIGPVGAWNSQNHTGCPVPGNRHIIVPNGDAEIDGNRGLLLDGAGDYLAVASSLDWQFDADFVIEAFAYPTIDQEHTLISWNSGGSAWEIRVRDTGVRRWTYISNEAVNAPADTTDPSLNVWEHILVSRSGTTVRMFRGGVEVGSSATISTAYSGAGEVKVGANTAVSIPWEGSLSRVHIQKGSDGGFTSNFTPPDRTSDIVKTANTVLALDFCGDLGGAIYDSATP